VSLRAESWLFLVWHDSCMSDMTQLDVMSLLNESWLICVWHNSLMCDTPRVALKWVMAHNEKSWLIEEQHHIWLSHDSFLSDMTHCLCHSWLSHVTPEWVMLRLKTSCHMWKSQRVIWHFPNPASHM